MSATATPEQIRAIETRLASGLTLSTSNRGGWNAGILSGAWIDHKFGEPLPAAMAAKIIAFLDRQATARASR